MAAWLPVLKTVLPYLTTVVTAAVPAFTARKDDGKSNHLVAQQIAELQTAVRGNAESVKILAEQLQRTIQAIEAGAVSAERRVRRAFVVSVISLGVAVVALAAVLAVLWAG